MVNYSRRYLQEYTWDPQWLDRIMQASDNLLNCIDANTKEITEALNNNSKSANFLAKVGIFVWVVWTFATIIWTVYGILSYLK